MDGFWLVQYEGMQGNGGGVAVFIKGSIFGGDSGATYMGTYRVDGNNVHARVKIHNYMPGVGSVIGIEGDYELDVTGALKGNVVEAKGVPVGMQAAGLALRLTKAAELPA